MVSQVMVIVIFVREAVKGSRRKGCFRGCRLHTHYFLVCSHFIKPTHLEFGHLSVSVLCFSKQFTSKKNVI